jgi:hypothetical protein
MNLKLTIPRSMPVADGTANFPTYTILVNDVSLLFPFISRLHTHPLLRPSPSGLTVAKEIIVVREWFSPPMLLNLAPRTSLPSRPSQSS